MNNQRRKHFSSLCFIALWMLLPWCKAFAGDSLQVENVQFTTVRDTIIVTYNLVPVEKGKAVSAEKARYDSACQITLLLKREGDASFTYLPKEVTGDVGSGIIPGNDKQIRWAPSSEFPDGLEGNDFYFIVLASPVVKNSHVLVWVGATAAVLAGATAAVLLLKSGPGTSSAEGFPLPPARP
jgi:hypothetical protein